MAREQAFNMEEEFAGLDCNSSRLEKRFVRTMETLSKQPDKSIWFSSENRAEVKAIYRMLGNEKLDREEVLRVHRESTIRRMAQHGGIILAVQDTMSLNYNTHEKTEGIGYISDKTLGALQQLLTGWFWDCWIKRLTTACRRKAMPAAMKAKRRECWRRKKVSGG